MEKWRKFRREVYRNRQRYVMFLPVLIFFLVFKYGSMYGSIIAFMDYRPVKGIFASEWVGLKHFIRFVKDPYFLRLLRNTVFISCGNILFGMPAAIILALSLNEVRSSKYKKFIQTVTYLPHFISLVVVCGMFKEFLSANGFLTNFLTIFGLPKKFAKIRYITLPCIMPTISVMLIMKLGHVMSVGYEKIILLYNTATYQSADVISSYVYRMGLAGDYPQFSYTTAVGLVSSAINITLVVIGNKISKSLKGSSLW